MRWNQAHQQAMIAAADAQEELGVDVFHRVDVFQAMARDRMKVMFQDLGGCAALYLPSVLGGRPGAIINAQHPLALQRYSGAHEYGHHVFEHGPQVDRAAEPRLSGTDLPPHEKLAEAFAAWFLMPPEAADVALEQLGLKRPRDPEDAYALALRLGASYTAACVHLPSLKLVDADEASGWARLELKKIKMALSATPPPGGWHNDVWVLTERDIGVPIVLRAGDRVVVRTTGACSPEEVPAGAIWAEDAPADLLELTTPTRRVTVDLPPDKDAGPARLVLTSGGSVLTFDLRIERPRRGLYVAPVEAAR